MTIVVDTNVLASGLLNPFGHPGRVVDLIVGGAIVLLYDGRILSEYRAVLARPRFGFPAVDIATSMEYLERAGEPVVARPLKVLLADPADLPFLEVAVAGMADALVTGNSRHYRASHGKHGVKVCNPAGFCTLIEV